MKSTDTIGILNTQLVGIGKVLEKSLGILNKRLGMISKLQKTNPPGDVTQTHLSEEVVGITNSMAGALDKVAKSLVRPTPPGEEEADAGKVLEELMKGGTKL